MSKVLIVASVVSFIEWFNKENIDYLRKQLQCEVHIAANTDYFEDTDEWRTRDYLDKIRDEGVIIHDIHFARHPFSSNNLSAYRRLKKLIDEEKFNLIHCHTPTASMLTRLAAREARRRGTIVMYTCHGFHFHHMSPKRNWMCYYPVEWALSRYCDYLVTINKEDYRLAQTFLAKNVRYIPGVGVDIKKIEAAVIDKKEYKKRLGLPNDCILILSVGEMIERKNHEVILRALARIPHSNLYFAIAGKGPLREYLYDLSVKLHIADRVLFLGFRNDIPELLHAADICAFPSRIEGLGLAGIEAMAAGVPLISSNVHGILDYVKNGVTGFALPPDDVEAFAHAIDRLASDSALRKGMKPACLDAVQPFAKENALREMWNIYDEILRKS